MDKSVILDLDVVTTREEVMQSLESFGGEILCWVEDGPGGGNPNMIVEFPNSTAARNWVTEFMCDGDESEFDADDYAMSVIDGVTLIWNEATIQQKFTEGGAFETGGLKFEFAYSEDQTYVWRQDGHGATLYTKGRVAPKVLIADTAARLNQN